ncbi:hypothetical protein LXL04_004821 [Taraxacum kok-saghyz]
MEINHTSPITTSTYILEHSFPIKSTTNASHSSDHQNDHIVPAQQILRRITKIVLPPVRLQDCFHTLTNLSIDNSTHVQVHHNDFPICYAFHTSTSLIGPIFRSLNQGIPAWEDAMQKELDSLHSNPTSDIVKLSKDGFTRLNTDLVFQYRHTRPAMLVERVSHKNMEVTPVS